MKLSSDKIAVWRMRSCFCSPHGFLYLRVTEACSNAIGQQNSVYKWIVNGKKSVRSFGHLYLNYKHHLEGFSVSSNRFVFAC